MSTFICPNCGWQDLAALKEEHYFRCGKCFKEWFLLEWVPDDQGEQRLLDAAAVACLFAEVDAIVNDFFRDKGVSL